MQLNKWSWEEVERRRKRGGSVKRSKGSTNQEEGK